MKELLSYFTFMGVLLFVIFAFVGSCSQPDKAVKVLEDQGYSNIETTGWRPFAKGQDDWWSTGFEADSPAGKRVSGTVSGGVWKGSTIRFD